MPNPDFWTSVNDFFKIYGTIIGILIGLIIPAILVNANRKFVIQQTSTSKTDQDLKIAQALKEYKKNLASEIEDNLGKSQTMKTLRDQIELRDTRIEELSTTVSTEQSARKAQDENIVRLNSDIANLTDRLAEETKARLTAVAELENLKSYSDILIQKLTTRVKRLEDYIREKGLPIPNGS